MFFRFVVRNWKNKGYSTDTKRQRFLDQILDDDYNASSRIYKETQTWHLKTVLKAFDSKNKNCKLMQANL